MLRGKNPSFIKLFSAILSKFALPTRRLYLLDQLMANNMNDITNSFVVKKGFGRPAGTAIGVCFYIIVLIK